jgi:hypothetical protein
MNMNNSQALLINPETGELLAQVSLLGEPFRGNPLASGGGQLQNYVIVEEKKEFRAAWFNQRDVMLQMGEMRLFVKITTYPVDGENQGILNFIRVVRKSDQYGHPIKKRNRGWLTLLQSIIST